MIGNGIVPSPSHFGVFQFMIGVTTFGVIASHGDGWDHVSVSVVGQQRCPTWEEMDAIKRKFFKPTETVMQLHPAEKDHVNIHNFTLHLWKPTGGRKIPVPPMIMV